MSVDFYANEYDVMEWKDIESIVPKEAAAFEQKVQESQMDLDGFCRAMKYDDWDIESDDWEEVVAQIVDAWDKLEEAFTKATTVEGAGLALSPEYHDPDYEDAVSFFAVEGVHQLTPAGAKYDDKIERRQFTGIG